MIFFMEMTLKLYALIYKFLSIKLYKCFLFGFQLVFFYGLYS